MSDQQVQPSEAPEAGQQPGTDPQGQAQTDGDRYVTPQYLDERLSRMETMIERGLKSSRDHTVQRVQDAIERLKQAGYTDEEIKEAQRRARVDQAAMSYQEAMSEPEGAAQPALSHQQVNKIMADVSKQHRGIAVTPGDPEASLLNSINPYATDEETFRRIYNQAVALKRDRIDSEAQEPPQAQQPTTPQAAPSAPNPATRTPTIASGTAPRGDEALRRQYDQEMEKLVARGAKPQEKIALRQQYRNRGLPL